MQSSLYFPAYWKRPHTLPQTLWLCVWLRQNANGRWAIKRSPAICLRITPFCRPRSRQDILMWVACRIWDGWEPACIIDNTFMILHKHTHIHTHIYTHTQHTDRGLKTDISGHNLFILSFVVLILVDEITSISSWLLLLSLIFARLHV